MIWETMQPPLLSPDLSGYFSKTSWQVLFVAERGRFQGHGEGVNAHEVLAGNRRVWVHGAGGS